MAKPLRCRLGIHKWDITSYTIALCPDENGLYWETTYSLCDKCHACKEVHEIVEKDEITVY